MKIRTMLKNAQFKTDYMDKMSSTLRDIIEETHENMLIENVIKESEYSLADVGFQILRSIYK